LSASLAFTKEDRNERYLVTVTTDELLKTRTSLTIRKVIPIIRPGVVSALPRGMKEQNIPHAPMGRITVTIGPAAPETVQ
jgi:hypothetical protein